MVTHSERAAQGRSDAAGDDRVFRAVLGRAQQLLAEVVIDGRVGRAADRAGKGNGLGAGAVAADEQLGRRGDERGVAAADAEDEAVTEGGAQDAEHRRRVVCGARVNGNLAGEHDLLELTPLDALGGAGDHLLEVLRRHDGRDARAGRRRRVEQRQGPADRSADARLGSVEVRPRDRQADVVAAADDRYLRHVNRRRGEPVPVLRPAAPVGEGKATHGKQLVMLGLRDHVAPPCSDSGETLRPLLLDAAHRAKRGERQPVPLPQKPRLVRTS